VIKFKNGKHGRKSPEAAGLPSSALTPQRVGGQDWGSSQELGLHYLSGWWFGTFTIFPYIGNVAIPTD